jgi:M6 family metalloprotease-like protein
MKRTLALVMSFCFLASAGWVWFNEEQVDRWLEQRQIVVDEEDDPPLIGLQANERWLVVLADFPDHSASEAWGPDEAVTLLEQAAVPYLEQMSMGQTTLRVDVHPSVIRASQALLAYGDDGINKDTNAEGIFLPALLAEEVVHAISDDISWGDYDLNDDGTVDRLLILHTTKGQEESPGITQRIWSHFTHFENTIDVNGDFAVPHYTMASLQTGSSGVGTMLHEMLHQMGAADLYPVHDESSFQSWKGPGDWDIMASGNWNGGGRWPALPSGATLDLIGAPQIETVELEWPATSPSPCIGPTIDLQGVSEGGVVLKVAIGTEESIYIEHRSDHGYDQRLPGHGVLVTYQDRSVGNLEQNELNTNPDLPWLKVIEADEGDELIRGINQGEASDLFTNNTMFGQQGVNIRNHDGILVPWTATVSIENGTARVAFTAANCSPQITLDLPNHGATILPNQGIEVQLQPTNTVCNASLESSDGRRVVLDTETMPALLRFDQEGMGNTYLNLRGTIACGESVLDLDYRVHTMNRIPVVERFESTVDPYSITTLSVPVASIGSGNQLLSVKLDGPLSRVATGPQSLDLNDGVMTLTVDPNGLLTENMLVFGTIIMSTEEGLTWELEVELQAESARGFMGQSVLDVHEIMAVLIGLFGLYTALPVVTRPTSKGVVEQPEATAESVQLDPWGRPVDEHESSLTFDVQK